MDYPTCSKLQCATAFHTFTGTQWLGWSEYCINEIYIRNCHFRGLLLKTWNITSFKRLLWSNVLLLKRDDCCSLVVLFCCCRLRQFCLEVRGNRHFETFDLKSINLIFLLSQCLHNRLGLFRFIAGLCLVESLFKFEEIHYLKCWCFHTHLQHVRYCHFSYASWTDASLFTRRMLPVQAGLVY